MSRFEWANEQDTMLSALECLNIVMLDNAELMEDSALAEAQLVKRRIEKKNLVTKEEITDFLKQATIDFYTMNIKGK